MSGLHNWVMTCAGERVGSSTHDEWTCKSCGDTRVTLKGFAPRRDAIVTMWSGEPGPAFAGCNEIVVSKVMES